jgi:hypothetical protein
MRRLPDIAADLESIQESPQNKQVLGLHSMPTNRCLRGRPCTTLHSNSEVFQVQLLDKSDLVLRETAVICKVGCHWNCDYVGI